MKTKYRVLAHLALGALISALFTTTSSAAGVADDFEKDLPGTQPASWRTGDSWYVARWGTNNLIENTDAKGDAPPRWLDRDLDQPITGAWEATFKYGWQWGGKMGTDSGNYTFLVALEMLDPQGNGCSVAVHQGILLDGTPEALIEIRPVRGGIAGPAAARGPGYDHPGWKTLELPEPALYPVRLTCSVGVLTAFRDMGKGWEVVARTTDNKCSTVSHVRLGASGWNMSEVPQIDDVRITVAP